MENETIQILELFGGIGSPRCALRNLNIPTKAIDYVEINEKAVRSYNSMFREELAYKTQTVVGWNLKPDILIHGSPCQDMSIAGHQGKATGEGRINRGKGSDEGSGTRSSLMWETIHIIENMGEWRPRYVIWVTRTRISTGRKQCRKETENITKHYMTKQETASPFRYSRAYSEKLFCMRSHKTGKGGKHMGNIVKTAKCRFCGQMTQIEADEELTAAQAEEQATMTCNCTDAVEYQKEKQRKEKAMQNVAALFGEAATPDKRCGEGIVKILKAAVEEIYTGGLAKVTLNLRGGVKASISQNSKGEINVERTETKKQKLTE